MKVPKEMLPRFVPTGDGYTFVPLEELIAKHLDTLFPGMEIVDYDVFRVTRDADFTVSDEADDLLQAVEDELRRAPLRRGRAASRSAPAMSAAMREQLTALARRRGARTSSTSPGLLDLEDLWDIVGVPGYAELRDPPWTPVTQPRLQPDEDEKPDVFAAMRHGDILLHHPYDSFATSVERFVEQAVADPDVLAIKQTVYRTSDDSPLVPALIRAAERGKQAVCLVEIKARFDERANIQWARALEEAGVHVVYGLPVAQDARQVPAGRPPRGRRRAPLRARRHRQLPPEDRAPLHRLRPAHLRRRDRRRRRRHVQLPHRLRAPARATAACSSRRRTCATGSSSEIERTIAAHRERPPRADPR